MRLKFVRKVVKGKVPVDGLSYAGIADHDRFLMESWEGKTIHVRVNTHWGSKAWACVDGKESNPLEVACLQVVRAETRQESRTTLVELEKRA